jgi:hypothetical protein
MFDGLAHLQRDLSRNHASVSLLFHVNPSRRALSLRCNFLRALIIKLLVRNSSLVSTSTSILLGLERGLVFAIKCLNTNATSPPHGIYCPPQVPVLLPTGTCCLLWPPRLRDPLKEVPEIPRRGLLYHSRFPLHLSLPVSAQPGQAAV